MLETISIGGVRCVRVHLSDVTKLLKLFAPIVNVSRAIFILECRRTYTGSKVPLAVSSDLPSNHVFSTRCSLLRMIHVFLAFT